MLLLLFRFHDLAKTGAGWKEVQEARSKMSLSSFLRFAQARKTSVIWEKEHVEKSFGEKENVENAF